MAWRWPGNKPLSEPMLVSLPMHICVTRPQWVNTKNAGFLCIRNWNILSIIFAGVECWHKTCFIVHQLIASNVILPIFHSQPWPDNYVLDGIPASGHLMHPQCACVLSPWDVMSPRMDAHMVINWQHHWGRECTQQPFREELCYICKCYYRQISNIRCTLTGNKLVDHSDVVGASPVGAAPSTPSFST